VKTPFLSMRERKSFYLARNNRISVLYNYQILFIRAVHVKSIKELVNLQGNFSMLSSITYMVMHDGNG